MTTDNFNMLQLSTLPSLLGTVGWVAGRACGLQKLSGELLLRLSVWSEVQMICIWSSWCHCHSIISCSGKIQNGLPSWCRLSQVVLEKRPLNRRSGSSTAFYCQDCCQSKRHLSVSEFYLRRWPSWARHVVWCHQSWRVVSMISRLAPYRASSQAARDLSACESWGRRARPRSQTATSRPLHAIIIIIIRIIAWTRFCCCHVHPVWGRQLVSHATASWSAECSLDKPPVSFVSGRNQRRETSFVALLVVGLWELTTKAEFQYFLHCFCLRCSLTTANTYFGNYCKESIAITTTKFSYS